jgi:hypothetical protein
LKLVFTPMSIVLGLIAGLVGKKIFEQIWGLIDDEEPPDVKHREISFAKLIAALLFEGAIFRLVKGLTDHGAPTSAPTSGWCWTPGRSTASATLSAQRWVGRSARSPPPMPPCCSMCLRPAVEDRCRVGRLEAR